MFSKKKVAKQRTTKTANKAGDSMDFLINPVGNDDDDDDEALEAELRRLTGGEDIRAGPKAPARRPKKIVPISQDINSDEEDDEDVDENDPELLNELKGIISDEEEPEADAGPEKISPTAETETTSLLEQRLQMYKSAEAKAKSQNDTSKARRYGRGVKTLQGLLRTALAGGAVDESDIPPALPPSALPHDESAIEQPDLPEAEKTEPPPVPEPVEPLEPPEPIPEPSEQPPASVPPAIDQEGLSLLKQRQQEYRIAAVKWKKSGNVEQALNHVKIAKQFDIVVAALNAGETVDLSDMPPSPQLPGDVVAVPEANVHAEPQKEESEMQESTGDATAPVTGEDIAGALKERLEVYRRTKTAAEEEGNSSKARRYGRICKQYEDAIKLHSKGKPVDFNELPTPPGFPPIAVDAPAPAASPSGPTRPAPGPPGSSEPEKAPKIPRKPMTNPKTRADKQIFILERRQAELKRAALAAKKDGDLELARDYLRQAKGIDPLINASRAGLPVDMSSLPLSPTAKSQLDASSDDSFALVSSEECQPIDENSTDSDIYDNLEATLIKQKKVCLSTRDHAKALGDVPGFNRWERLALGYSKDLDMLRVRRRDGLPPPQHHYEVKTYAIVQSCTDLNDGDVEIQIVRGINYPKEADTYVIYEFPYPSDSPPTDRTSTIKNTNEPEYDATFTLAGIVDRSSRPCQRAFKRHGLKCQVWSKGGFFRSDSLLGTVTVKLLPLESQCTLHDSFPLMNGRKAAGGNLEVKIRLRNPILTKQIEKMTDKWLIIDN
ncbi:coiled-coil and C2 domain-containing protein 1-like isoform X2 [Fopius arisanus]|uniref:Coiled-coil and C2 domain-containing protein 1-like isoform X2 n=1 Tax=Fopius arisanus TaxID=64838 RepID=A0A9R1TM75_9HYME|nr:PREDICTED: coiled-coil and C2 domain-containing protein 1-like isoform X2 [Fopius arisanus]